MKSLTPFLIVLGISAPALAQSPDSGANADQPRGVSSSRTTQVQPISLRAYALFSEQAFTAKTTFDAIFGNNSGPFFGGGGQVILANGIFFDVSGSRFSRSGERAFISGGQAFQLGIPLKATITPIDGS